VRKVNRRVDAVRRIAEKSIATLLAATARNFMRLGALFLWREASSILLQSRIRIFARMAFEGQLFRSVLEEFLQAHGIHTEVVIERDAYAKAAVELKRSDEKRARCDTESWSSYGRAVARKNKSSPRLLRGLRSLSR